MYFQNKEHFFNYLKKIIREEKNYLDIDKILNEKDELIELFETIYKLKLCDKYTWELRNDLTKIYKDEVVEFIQLNRKRIDKNFLTVDDSNSEFTEKFKNTIQTLNYPGCYLYSNSNKKYYYIGMSNNIQSRALGSFEERFKNKKIKLYFEYYTTKTTGDAAILEQYLIAFHRPILNNTVKYDGKPEIKLLNIPEKSKRILVLENATK